MRRLDWKLTPRRTIGLQWASQDSCIAYIGLPHIMQAKPRAPMGLTKSMYDLYIPSLYQPRIKIRGIKSGRKCTGIGLAIVAIGRSHMPCTGHSALGRPGHCYKGGYKGPARPVQIPCNPPLRFIMRHKYNYIQYYNNNGMVIGTYITTGLQYYTHC